MDYNNHKYEQDMPPVPGECTFTYPDGMMCGYEEWEHPLPPEKEYNGN